MATIKAPRSMVSPKIPVDMYVQGKLYRNFDSISECARTLSISYLTVKYLLATGTELYTVPYSVTFDIPTSCPYSYILIKDESGKYIPVIRDDRSGEILS